MFLEKDLRHCSVTAEATSNRNYKRTVKRIAAEIITRGKAYATVVKTALPDYVR
jgi:pyoverdine/dityrosine biosynthesis protein Dit1